MAALGIIIFLSSVAYSLGGYAIEEMHWYEGGCQGGCNKFFGPTYGNPKAIKGYCPKGEKCFKRHNFYLVMKNCCDDISFNYSGLKDNHPKEYHVEYFNSVVVMYGYYILDYFKPVDVWNQEGGVLNEDMKKSLIPLYPTKSKSGSLTATVLYALKDGTCRRVKYELTNYEWEKLLLEFKVYIIKNKPAEEQIDCSEFENARNSNDCLDCNDELTIHVA